jgi:hypothetical protein
LPGQLRWDITADRPVCGLRQRLTPDSGTATATAIATDSATARVNRPAPTRNAALPASMAAPGVPLAPPITHTSPRLFLPLPVNSGSGQFRNN